MANKLTNDDDKVRAPMTHDLDDMWFIRLHFLNVDRRSAFGVPPFSTATDY